MKSAGRDKGQFKISSNSPRNGNEIKSPLVNNQDWPVRFRAFRFSAARQSARQSASRNCSKRISRKPQSSCGQSLSDYPPDDAQIDFALERLAMTALLWKLDLHRTSPFSTGDSPLENLQARTRTSGEFSLDG